MEPVEVTRVQAMDASRRDYFRHAKLLERVLAGLLVAGLVGMWLLAHARWWWFELLCVIVLLGVAGGIFVVSSWLFTRHHPVISVFADRLWFRGLREQVVMLRNVRGVRMAEQSMAGMTRRWLELTLGNPRDPDDDDTEGVRIGLDAVECDPAELMQLIGQRAELVREQAAPR